MCMQAVCICMWFVADLCSTGRPNRTMRHGHTVRCRLTTKTPTLHTTCKTLTNTTRTTCKSRVIQQRSHNFTNSINTGNIDMHDIMSFISFVRSHLMWCHLMFLCVELTLFLVHQQVVPPRNVVQTYV